jgi:1,5-anhydro-D-fructose reductase (1,5-anhydro-D-mannitol-forming)
MTTAIELCQRMPFSAASSREVIRWGIIGCGDVTEVKSGPGFQKAAGSRLVAVMRRDAARAADYAQRHRVARWYDDAAALVNDPEVDAIYVATPPGAHVEGARLAAGAGKPCYIEKPMARSASECDAMLAAANAAGQKLFVAYYRRAQPRFLKIKELLASGVLGQLTGINYRMSMPTPTNADPAKAPWRLDTARSGGGLLLDMGSHVLDLLDFFFGPLEAVHGDAARIATAGLVEDAVAMTFRAGGVPGAATWNFASHIKEDVLEFTGTAGRVSASVFGTEAVQLETAHGPVPFEFPTLPHVAQPLIQTVVNELLGRGTCPSTGDSARRTSQVMDRVLAGYYGGRDDAFWTRPQTWPGARNAG